MRLLGQSIRVNGMNMNVVVEGTGPAVLLLHGFPDSAYLWRNQIPVLAGAGYQVIAPDLRGFGETDAPAGKGSYTMDIIVRDITSLMDVLGIEKACVAGHDWGAIAGWYLAIGHPGRVERYAAVSVGHPGAFASAGLEQKIRSWYAGAFQLRGIAEMAARLHDWLLVRKLTRDHPEAAHWISDLQREGRLTAGMNWYRANFIRMLLGDESPSKVPVLGIWSTGDSYLTERQMKNSVRYVEAPWTYERIEGSSHWIPLDAPDRLNSILLDFFGQAFDRNLAGLAGQE
jgi:pimeloyl-ACP methyl ester carboxylesterase